MSTPKEDLQALVDSMSDSVAADVLPRIRLIKLEAEARAERTTPSAWPPAWVGSVDGTSPDFSERIDEMLAEGLGRSPK
ncbi:hypothetical protein GCM10029976_077890 [Kribbella albertanoniae]|uniref:Uncharacterized protein n=1 Tax=Kribbella albertanoniae TaxID=1266829 RepID=A0A4R4PHJ0_9ACTN|nr:hypothetical protein [Kribbella albertanoniae]TDC21450.1 hypothetical protein E1261_33290 [Kribbella albertanoniae]